MRRLTPRLLPLLAILAVAGGCSNSDTGGTPVTTPPPPTTTDTFSGTVTLNGAVTHPFVGAAAGGITATLTTLAGVTPDTPTVPIGMSLGTWNGSICQQVLPNDAAVQGAVVLGQTSSAGNFCVRLYDPAGTVVSPESYVVTVTHP